MLKKRLHRGIGFLQFRLAEERMDLPVADAMKRLRLPSTAALGHEMMLVALILRDQAAA